MNAIHKEAVGQAYSLEGMLHARDMTWRTVEEMARRIKPGMRESEALAMGLEVMKELGMDRIWHPTKGRFAPNPRKILKHPPGGAPRGGENDFSLIPRGGVGRGKKGKRGP